MSSDGPICAHCEERLILLRGRGWVHRKSRTTHKRMCPARDGGLGPIADRERRNRRQPAQLDPRIVELTKRLQAARAAPGMAHLILTREPYPTCRLCGGRKAPIVNGEHIDPKYCQPIAKVATLRAEVEKLALTLGGDPDCIRDYLDTRPSEADLQRKLEVLVSIKIAEQKAHMPR